MGDLPTGMTWAQAIGGLMILLGTGGIVIVLAEMLCGMIDLQRREPESEDQSDADADAIVRDLAAEIEAEAAAAVKRCGVR